MTPVLEHPVRHLLARLDADTPRWVVGLAGLPGSGKSTLAARLAREVNALAGPDAVVALGMDGFHLTQAALRRMQDPAAALRRRGAPWTFDVAALAGRLRDLRGSAGQETVPWPEFGHEVGDPVEAGQTVVAGTRLILVEGLYLLKRDAGWGEVSGVFDERWYLDTPLDVSLERLARRHVAVWGLTRAEAEARIAENDGLNAQIVLETRDRADWLLAGE